ncbi:MAG: GH32 C-terminal domain-containing protein, partial [Bacteroidales bacterium]|nr:GH32 C-terminal domain-containing protein [Bacteroidales bacterium]
VLRSAPSPELLALRGPAVKVRAGATPAKLFAAPRQACELVVRFTAPRKGEAAFVLSNAAGEQVRFAFDAVAGTFTMDRTAAGESGFSREFPAVTVAPTAASGRVELRLLLDSCSIEAFGPDFAMTNLVFPSAPYNEIRSVGSARLDLTLYPLAP